MKTYKLKCEILSPIHIGSGNELDPLNYIIDKDRLYKISFEKFVAELQADTRNIFEAFIERGDLIAIRKFVADHINKDNASIYSTEASATVASLYKAKMNDIQNQLLIYPLYPFIRTERDTLPLLPGSSIKGAIRTAVISEFAKKSNLPRPQDVKEEYSFEARVLGYKDGKDDPFRGIKIRDQILQKNDTIVRDIRNVSRKKGEQLRINSIQIICEVLHSSVTGKTMEFETDLSFDEELYSTGFLSKTITVEQVISACKSFYRDKMEYEHKRFYQNSEINEISAQLLSIPLNDNAFLLRIGRFSGVESVTLDNYRNPKPPGNKTVWGTSRNLAEGKYPMGWVKVTVC